MKLIIVSAVALIDRDARVLIAQRPRGKSMEGLWEFPGGKIELGETPEEALIRELYEELGIEKEKIDLFLKDKVEGENFNKFIVIKDSKKGPYLTWVKVGVSDLYNVEIIEGLNKGDVVYILPSKSLFDYQERFKERVSGSFSFG